MGNTDDKGGEDTQDITAEMDAYYQTEDKSKSGSAVLYGLFALVVTLIVAAGLFFGGRAVYRALTGTSSDDETSQQQNQDQNPAQDKDVKNTQDTDNGTNQTPGVASGGSSDSADSEDDDSSSSARGSYDDMPSTGDNLPATGSPTGM